MQLYLVTDCLSVSGVLFGGYPHPPWSDLPALREQAPRERMAHETAAVAEACLACGATDILIHEAHPLELRHLPEGCRVLRGANRLLLDETFDGVLFVGRRGDPALRPPPNSRQAGIASLRLNGAPADEMALIARFAGDMGVPVALVSGEPEAADAARRMGAGGATIVAAEGEGGAAAAEGVPLALAAVREGRAPVVAPQPDNGYRLDVEFATRFHAERHDRFEEATLTAPCATRVAKDTFAELFEAYLRLGIVLDSTSFVLPRLVSRNERAK